MNRRDEYFFTLLQKINEYANVVKNHGDHVRLDRLHREVSRLTSPLLAAMLRDAFDNPTTRCAGCNRHVSLEVACPFCAADSLHQ